MVIYVNCEQYDFYSVTNAKKGKYIYQYIDCRKLSDVYHTHDFYEICIVLYGSVTERFNNEIRVLNENTITMLRPGDAHCFIGQSEKARLICLSVENSEAIRMLESLNIVLPEREISFNSEGAASCVANMLFPNMAEHHCRLLFCLVMTLLADSNTRMIPAVLQNALQKMHTRENMRAGIERLTELAGYSRSHLARLVHEYYGASLHDMLSEIRLKSAYDDIVLTNEPIEDIAADIGYLSLSHFNKIFKGRFGVTPAMLRKKKGMWTV